MKILILGIGNILFGDEGVGVHLAHLLTKNYHFKSNEHTIKIVDGGTLAQFLIPLITAHDKVLILDCVHVGADSKIGEVYAFDFKDVPLSITWQGSAHEVEMLQTLKMTEINGDLPDVRIIGIIPEVIDTDTTFELSDSIIKGAKLMESLALEYLKQFNIDIEQIADYPLQQLAHETFRGF